jgi:hypothetical protein
LGADEDAVVIALLPAENVEEFLNDGAFGGRGTLGGNKADGSAVAVGNPCGGLLGMCGKERGEFAMDGAGAGAALGLLVLEFVEFAEDFEGDAEVIIAETVKAVRVVQEYVGIEDEVLPDRGRGL